MCSYYIALENILCFTNSETLQKQTKHWRYQHHLTSLKLELVDQLIITGSTSWNNLKSSRE